MLYPLARAFGSPTESELRKCRVAFDDLKARWATARVVVYAAGDPTGAREGGFAGTADLLAGRLREAGWAACSVAPAAAPVEPTPLEGNQLRYAWKRARAYAKWVQGARPGGDFLIFTEVLTSSAGGVVGIHMFVVEGDGEVAYQRLLNSHHFATSQPPDPAAACGLILQVFLRDLGKSADEVFPPYGVG